MHRWRLFIVCVLAVATVVIFSVIDRAESAPQRATHGRRADASGVARHRSPPKLQVSTTSAKAVSLQPPFAVGLRVIRFVDLARRVQLPDGKIEPRILVTYVRYPALGRRNRSDVASAPAARAAGPYPLIVFGHGYAATPALYTHLLLAWARAGYVVAAPVFPLGNANAPGGPNEADLVHQPADVRFVITRMLAASASDGNPLSGMIDLTHIAVAGQSDGGDTALAVAYDSYFRDRRVGAAVILSGAEIPGVGGFDFPQGSPPLLAIQGTADTVNPPYLTSAFYSVASRPKFLLTVVGATHMSPYTDQGPQLPIVERATIAFLDHYLKGGPLERLLAAGSVPGIAQLASDP